MRIGLSLSGGGFRATLFHIGVIRFLHDADLLRCVTHICSVSGGSVLAAHLVQNWERYNGKESEFEDAAGEIIKFARYDVRGRIIRRIPLCVLAKIIPNRIRPRWINQYSRTGLLEKYYSKHLYHNQPLAKLAARESNRPLLHILATNLTNGGLCSFTSGGFSIDFEPKTNRALPSLLPAGKPPIGLAVAASSAFPGFFPPVEINPRTIGVKRAELNPESQYFTDGGVYDNLGFRKFRQLLEQRLGSHYLYQEDLKDPDEFLHDLREAAKGEGESVASHIVALVSNDFREMILHPPGVDDIGKEELLLRLLAEINVILHRPEFFDRQIWRGTELDQATQLLIDKGLDTLSTSEVVSVNRRLLEVAFPKQIKPNAGSFDLLIMSNAEREFDRMAKLKFFGLGAPLRATDILMHRVTNLEKEITGYGESKMPSSKYVHVEIEDKVDTRVDRSALDGEVQGKLSGIRTDFDRFSPVEISTLIAHGYCVTRAKLRKAKLGLALPNSIPWDPMVGSKKSDDAVAMAKELEQSAQRRLGLFRASDWISYANITVIGIAVALVWLIVVETSETRADLVETTETLVGKTKNLKMIEERRLQAELVGEARSPSKQRVASFIERAVPEGRFLWGVVANKVGEKIRGVHTATVLAEPDYSGFEILSDDRTVDLRAWRPVEEYQMGARVSPAVWTRRTYLRPRSDAEHNTTIRFQYRTTGPAIDLSCPEFPFEVRRAAMPDSEVGPGQTTVWEIEVDVSSIALGISRDIVTEAVFWNGFQAVLNEWAAIKIDGQVERASLRIIFPVEKPFKSYELLKYPIGARGQRSVVEGVVTVDESNHSLYWQISSPDPSHIYEVAWTW